MSRVAATKQRPPLPSPLLQPRTSRDRYRRGGRPRRFMVPMHVSRTLELSMNRRMNMPLLRSLRRDQGALWAIDMALLRSFSNRFKIPAHV